MLPIVISRRPCGMQSVHFEDGDDVCHRPSLYGKSSGIHRFLWLLEDA
jgi:hypothetical protein